MQNVEIRRILKNKSGRNCKLVEISYSYHTNPTFKSTSSFFFSFAHIKTVRKSQNSNLDLNPNYPFVHSWSKCSLATRRFTEAIGDLSSPVKYSSCFFYPMFWLTLINKNSFYLPELSAIFTNHLALTISSLSQLHSQIAFKRFLRTNEARKIWIIAYLHRNTRIWTEK